MRQERMICGLIAISLMTLRKAVRRFVTIQRKQRFMKLNLIVIGCACLELVGTGPVRDAENLQWIGDVF